MRRPRRLEAQHITVVGAISEQHVAAAERIEHVGGAPAIVRLSGRQLECNRQRGIDHRADLVDQSPRERLCRQAHVPGRYRARPFLPLACTRIDELSIFCRSPTQSQSTFSFVSRAVRDEGCVLGLAARFDQGRLAVGATVRRAP